MKTSRGSRGRGGDRGTFSGLLEVGVRSPTISCRNTARLGALLQSNSLLTAQLEAKFTATGERVIFYSYINAKLWGYTQMAPPLIYEPFILGVKGIGSDSSIEPDRLNRHRNRQVETMFSRRLFECLLAERGEWRYPRLAEELLVCVGIRARLCFCFRHDGDRYKRDIKEDQTNS